MPKDHPKGVLSAATRGKVTETRSNLSKVFDWKKKKTIGHRTDKDAKSVIHRGGSKL